MSRYLELKQQAEALLEQAEAARQQEITQAIEQVKVLVATYGLTAQDIGLASKTAKSRTKPAASSPKYRGPNGELWSGGRGRKPGWVMKALQAGKSLDEFAIHRH